MLGAHSPTLTVSASLLGAKLPEEMAAKRALTFATSMKIWSPGSNETSVSTGLRREIVVPSGLRHCARGRGPRMYLQISLSLSLSLFLSFCSCVCVCVCKRYLYLDLGVS